MNVLPIDEIIRLSIAKLMFKIIKFNEPVYLRQKPVFRHNVNQRQTRNNNSDAIWQLQVPIVKTNHGSTLGRFAGAI